ncbi:FAD-binding oxidoreductase [Cupriavidus sp. L7L]|uniref:FAD-binding oxidoreductase n=1 Tax=Cupriavidus sp. L7L TaxID=2546443 RepID=UPI0010565C58|nr:FAD-binding oxidoreductase [Cupriavidus sp. L7L]TDF64975.1 FAD-binding oxidoreductase [Cupriavidus sp. L7L]
MSRSDVTPIEEKYLHDWSGRRYGVPSAVVRPLTVEDLRAILAEANNARTSCAIQGGRTGVSGGCAPGDGELVVALESLNKIEEVDPVSGIAVVQGGVVLETLQTEVERLGWSFPVDLGSRGSCQVGGNAATNAGGSRVVKYGNMREWVLGVEAVLANGALIGPPNRLVKNNAGYSLSSLLIGSEGTLGVISRLALRLVPLVPVRRTLLMALSPEANVNVLLREAKTGLREALSAFEIMWPDYVDAAMLVQQRARPLPASFTGLRAALIEVEGDGEATIDALLESFLTRQMEDGSVVDAIVSMSSQDAAALWAIRESVGEIQATIRPYAGFDLGMPAKDHDEFAAKAKALLLHEMPQCRSFFFGHIGDDNLHALVGPCLTPEERATAERLLFELMPPLTTSVTAEHGIGRKRKPYLSMSRSPADITVMKNIKAALDPHNILNRGRVFDMPIG